MKISLLIPSVNHSPTHRPRACRYCAKPILHRHGTLKKPVRDHGLREVEVHRYKCLSCGRTFRHYPNGVSKKDQSERMVVLAALMYGLGVSCSAASHLLGAFEAEVSEITRYGKMLRRRGRLCAGAAPKGGCGLWGPT